MSICNYKEVLVLPVCLCLTCPRAHDEHLLSSFISKTILPKSITAHNAHVIEELQPDTRFGCFGGSQALTLITGGAVFCGHPFAFHVLGSTRWAWSLCFYNCSNHTYICFFIVVSISFDITRRNSVVQENEHSLLFVKCLLGQS